MTDAVSMGWPDWLRGFAMGTTLFSHTFNAGRAVIWYFRGSTSQCQSVSEDDATDPAEAEQATKKQTREADYRGRREATLRLSTSWEPWGYIVCGEKISRADGTRYSSIQDVKVSFEIWRYQDPAPAMSEKGKEKESELPAPRAPKIVLEKARMVKGDARPRLGYGTQLVLKNEISTGTDSRGDYYQFSVSWAENCVGGNFDDIVWVKCYNSGEVYVSDNFYEACENWNDVATNLSFDAKLALQGSRVGKPPQDDTLIEIGGGQALQEVLTGRKLAGPGGKAQKPPPKRKAPPITTGTLNVETDKSPTNVTMADEPFRDDPLWDRTE